MDESTVQRTAATAAHGLLVHAWLKTTLRGLLRSVDVVVDVVEAHGVAVSGEATGTCTWIKRNRCAIALKLAMVRTNRADNRRSTVSGPRSISRTTFAPGPGTWRTHGRVDSTASVATLQIRCMTMTWWCDCEGQVLMFMMEERGRRLRSSGDGAQDLGSTELQLVHPAKYQLERGAGGILQLWRTLRRGSWAALSVTPRLWLSELPPMPKLARLAGLAAVSSLPLTFLQSRRGLSSGGFPPQTCACEGYRPGGSKAAPAGRRPALSAAQVEDFLREGPLYKKLLLCCSPPYSSEWIRHGEVLAERLGPSLPGSTEEEKIARRIYHFYLPVYYWMRQQMAEIRASRELRGEPAEAICFGLSAPQGCGKTTMVTLLEELFRLDGLSCESLSIDDFYLPASWQEAVSELHSENPLMQTRGNAGTHDVQLGTRTLKALRSRNTEVFLPRYDKSADSGRGDQVPQAMWKPAKTPCDVLLLEGWMLGFKPTSDREACPSSQSSLARGCGTIVMMSRLWKPCINQAPGPPDAPLSDVSPCPGRKKMRRRQCSSM
eukprot:s3587_g11.t1